jgi:zinc D-Ala-D-Ala carboxypeptidase
MDNEINLRRLMISKYLTLEEATRSNTAKKLGIQNLPTPEHLVNMKRVATQIFDKVRDHIGGPLFASSFYRSPELNQAIGGSSVTSQHMKGEAIDIDTKRYGVGTNKQVFDFIRKNLDFDQLLWEFGTHDEPEWVHVSLKKEGNRRQVLRVVKINGQTKYLPYV